MQRPMNFQGITAGTGATQIIQIHSQDLQPNFFKTSNYEAHKDINPPRVSDTCLWFLEHPNFQNWKTSNHDDLLWLSARPGYGKSVLSRAMIDEKLVSAGPATICYFFFKDNDDQNNVATALCALLHQLFWARKEIFSEYACPAYEKCGENLKSEIGELWRTFISAAADPSSGNVICVLDALDECREADRKELIDNLEEFYNLKDGCSPREHYLKFVVTSRPYCHIEGEFSALTQEFPTIRLNGDNETDQKLNQEIKVVIEAKVKDIARRCGLNKHLRSCLQDRLCKTSERTYLWLYLTLDEVRTRISKGKTEKRLLSIINTLPMKVEEAYESILSRCDQNEARKTLQIVVAARRPLKLAELDVALEIEPDSNAMDDLDLLKNGREESLRASCGLFLQIVDGYVHLIHQTAKEFLVNKGNTQLPQGSWRNSIDLKQAHRALAQICITAISLRPSKHNMKKKSKKRPPFLRYSVLCWVYHVQEADDNDEDWLRKTTRLCDIVDPSSWVWSKLPPLSRFRYEEMTRPALFWAVVLGLVHETKYLLKSFCEDEDCAYEDILSAAAGSPDYGETMMQILLDYWKSKAKITDEVLKRAAENRTFGKEVMELLLDTDPQGLDIKISEEMLKAAACNRSCGKEVMALLLNFGKHQEHIITDVVIGCAVGEPCEKEKIAMLLEHRKSEIRITEKMIWSAIGWCGHEQLKLLLDRAGADFEITNDIVSYAIETDIMDDRKPGQEVLALLLDRRLARLDLRTIAVGTPSSDESGNERFSDQQKDEMKSTEEIEKSSVQYVWSDFLELCLFPPAGFAYQCGFRDPRSLETYCKEIMGLVLRRREDEVAYMMQLSNAAELQQSGNGGRVISVDEGGDETVVTEQMVAAITQQARNYQAIVALICDEWRCDKIRKQMERDAGCV